MIPGLRFVQVKDDHLDPTIRRLDYVLLASADRYIGEGYYLLSNYYGEPASYHCSGFGECKSKPIQIRILNKLYQAEPQSMSKAEFSRAVVGKIAMNCTVQDHSLIAHHVEGHIARNAIDQVGERHVAR